MLVQQRFLGASIVSFNGSMGWGQNPSSLNVVLVEDKDNGDWFSPPPVGSPVEFNYSGWYFRGLLQSYKKNRGISGETYSLVLIDPREILDGVQVITGGHTGSATVVPNLLNVYDYLESTGFGDSERNSAGIPWKKVKDAITDLTQAASSYGGEIHLRGYRYKVDISSLPNLDESYRVGGSDQMTLMGFITEICEAANHDFYIDLDSSLTIRINTISRVNQPTPGALTTYINSIAPTLGITSSEAGVEFRNDTCSKYLLGAAKREFIFHQTALNKSGQPLNQDLWPFWGFDKDDQLIIGQGINDDHEFTLDSRSLNEAAIGESYRTDVAEMRAAAASFDSWTSLLSFRNENLNYPQAFRYDNLKLIGVVDTTSISGANTPVNKNLMAKEDLRLLEGAMSTDLLERQQKVYNFVKQYADNYYGRKFMVTLPNLKLYKNPEEYNYQLNYEPTDGAFLDSAQWSGAVAANLMPPETLRLMNEDGTFPCYSRYDNAELLDFSEVPDSEMLWRSDKKSVFIKSEASTKVGFDYVSYNGLGTPDYSGARAVVTIPGVVRFKNAGSVLNNFNVSGTAQYTDLGALLKTMNADAVKSGIISQTLSNTLLNAFGVDTVYDGTIGAAVIPNMVAVPLKDNTKRYGPWYAAGADGKVEFEIDENLAPWNYGGYDRMNLIANAKVRDGISQMQQSETGSLEIPGIPTFTMGQQLVAGGPYITDIDVNIGQQGVTSIYRFSTWNPQFGQLRKSYLDRINRLTQQTTELRNISKGRAEKNKQRGITKVESELYLKQKVTNIKRLTGHTSHGIISGEGIVVDSGNTVPNCWVQPFYNFTTQLSDYERKAGVSIDGLFRPFTTNVNGSGLGIPRFESPENGAAFPTINDLNPYSGWHDINVVIRGSSLPSNLATSRDTLYGYETDYRSMALRGPILIAGWGFDTNSNPVPSKEQLIVSSGINSSGNWIVSSGYQTQFVDDYRKRQDLWKVGPLDTRWNNDRKVWEANGGSKTKIVRLESLESVDSSGNTNYLFPMGFNKVYRALEIVPAMSGGPGTEVYFSSSGTYINVGNFRRNIAVLSGIYVANEINGSYFLDNQLTFFGGII